MSDLLERVFDEFADATEQAVQRLAEQVATLRAEIVALREEQRAAVALPPPPAAEVREGPAGRGVAGAGVRDGHLVLRYTDGAEDVVGRVVGERGEDGAVDPDQLRALIRAEMPVPEPGKDGDPGVGVRSVAQMGGDLILTLTDGSEHNVGRVVGERGEDGAASHEEIAALVDARVTDVQTRTLADTYRGVWRAGERYRRGQTATWGGSLFLALADTGGKPTETTDWQQITKRGRDGRDAR